MRLLLSFFLICISFVTYSQEMKRDIVQGKIIVEGDDIEGITIYNATSAIGTVTNKNGEFTIAVAVDDLLEIRALEYQNFDVVVNKEIGRAHV